jgi:hypothetical protein
LSYYRGLTKQQPGRTEITILNLTPLPDPNSLKIEGHGTSAVVTDITIDLIAHRASSQSPPNPDSGSDSDSSSSDEESLVFCPERRV